MAARLTCRRGAVVLAAVLVSACGPASALAVDVRNVQQDSVFGGPRESPAPVVAPPPAAALEPGSPPFIGSPIPFQPAAASANFAATAPPVTSSTATPTPATTCPSPASATPSSTATDTTTAPPDPGTYHYRQDGGWTAGGHAGTLPTSVARSVGKGFAPPGPANVPTLPGSPATATVEWTVDELSSDAHGWLVDTTTTYGLYPGPTVQPGTAGIPATTGSIGIAQINTVYVTGPLAPTADDFIPSTPLTIIQFPVSVQQQPSAKPFETRATDRNASSPSARVMQIGGQVKPDGPDEGKVTVNACGTLIEGWKVDLVQDFSGLFGSPGTPCYVLNGSYVVATQLALVVNEHFSLTGGTSTANGCDTTTGPFASNRNTTINQRSPG